MRLISMLSLGVATCVLLAVSTGCVAPRDAAYYFELGRRCDAAKELDGAVEAYSKGIALDPADAQLHFHRGLAHYRLRHYEDAVADFSRGIELDEEEPQAYYARGCAFALLSEPLRAITDFTKALELDPRNAEYLCARGNVYSDLEEYAPARADLDLALIIDPKLLPALNLRACIDNNEGHYERALEQFTQAITLDPNNAELYAKRGIVRANLQQLDLAAEDFRHAIELEPAGAWATDARERLENLGRVSTRFRLQSANFTLDADTVACVEVTPLADDKRYGLLIKLSDIGWADLQRICNYSPCKFQVYIGERLVACITNAAGGNDALWPREGVWAGPLSDTPVAHPINMSAGPGFSRAEAEELRRAIQQADDRK